MEKNIKTNTCLYIYTHTHTHTHTHMCNESLCGTPETNTTL